jgi:hypothetical protein
MAAAAMAMAKIDLAFNVRLLREALQHRQALEGEPDVDLSGELVADAPCAASGGSGAEGFFLFEEQYIFYPAPGEMVYGTGPHHTAPDDYDVCCSG